LKGQRDIDQYDTVALSFDRYRALPDGVSAGIRAAILDSISASSRSRVLDVGAGTGRIGRAFVATGDDYVGLDLSSGMLGAFVWRAKNDGHVPRLVQADGQLLLFADAAYDAVMLIQIFGALRDWRPFLAEAQRVLRSAGALIIGCLLMPADGVDAQVRQRLESTGRSDVLESSFFRQSVAMLLAPQGSPFRIGGSTADQGVDSPPPPTAPNRVIFSVGRFCVLWAAESVGRAVPGRQRLVRPDERLGGRTLREHLRGPVDGRDNWGRKV